MLSQPGKVIGEAGAAVFHEHQGSLHPCNLVEAQIDKQGSGAGLGAQEQMGVAPAVLDLGQVGDHPVQQTLALMAPVHGEAAQRGAEAAAGGNHLIAAVVDGAGVVQIPVTGDALLLQEPVHGGHGGPVPGEYPADGVIVEHNAPPQTTNR